MGIINPLKDALEMIVSKDIIISTSASNHINKKETLEMVIKECLAKKDVRFIDQPNGSQNYPDFFIPDYLLNIEAKSSQTRAIQWNSTMPYPEGLYIISLQKGEEIFVVKGSDLITQDNRDRLIEYHKAAKKRVEDDRHLFENDNFYYYQRGKFDMRSDAISDTQLLTQKGFDYVHQLNERRLSRTDGDNS